MFGEVINILIIVDQIFLEVSHMKVDYFDSHYHAYVVSHTSNKSFVTFHNLKYPCILHGHKRNDVILFILSIISDVNFCFSLLFLYLGNTHISSVSSSKEMSILYQNTACN